MVVSSDRAADTLTSDSSTSPFDNEELAKVLRLIDNIQGLQGLLLVFEKLRAFKSISI